tara:strand:+ start:262 stop:1269 length:1008 start_codon:yes stop_codon:yes gene_type:complete
MRNLYFGRRKFLSISLLATLVGLSGCGFSRNRRTLYAFIDSLPKELIRELPSHWQYKTLENNLSVETVDFRSKEFATDMLAIGDGWLGAFQPEDFLSLEADELFSRLNNQAGKFLNALEDGYQKKILPIGVSPWVMVFRNSDTLIDKAKESWEVLLDPALKDQIILPNSPRLLISLVDKIRAPDRLQELRLQAKTFDDRNSLNWLLSGRAKVAVLPLQRCMSSLIRDPRLNVALPEEGAPLNWTLLMRPFSSQNATPLSWIEECWQFPVKDKLLAKGWIPPIDYSEFSRGPNFLVKRYQSTLLPSERVWERCWSLPPLNQSQIKKLGKRWTDSIP